MRSPKGNMEGVASWWSPARMSTEYFDAIRINLDYIQSGARIGLGYERIDPGYKTLGAYYFTNDLENITLNASQSLFQNKLNISINLGFQHDNLANDKANATSRLVGALNVNANISERLTANASYSNFQTYTNVRSDFDRLNQLNRFDNLDTLNFVQLSQSINLNMSLMTKKNEIQQHHLTMNMAYQDAADKQGGIYRPGSISEIINGSGVYNISFLKTGMGLSLAANFNSSKINSQETMTYGPSLGVSGSLFNKKLRLSENLSYNRSSVGKQKQAEVFMNRVSASYNPYKTHNITFSYHYQWRAVVNRDIAYSSIATMGYAYNF